MKSKWPNLALILIIFSLPSCYKTLAPKETANRKFDIDLPDVFAGSNSGLRYTLEINNDSDSDLEVVGVEKSCTCTNADLLGIKIKKGDVAKYPISISTGSAYERRSVDIVLVLQSGAKWRYSLHFNVFPVAAFDRKIIEFGFLNDQLASEEFTVVLSPDDKGVRPSLIDVSSMSPFLEIQKLNDIKPDESKANVYKANYKVSLKKPPYDGSQMAYINLKYLINSSHAEVALPVTWNARHVLSTTPSRLFLDFNIVSHSQQNQKFILRSQDGKDFKILDLKADCDAVEFQWDRSSRRNSHIFNVKINSALIKEDAVCDIVVDTDVTPGVMIKVPVILIGKR